MTLHGNGTLLSLTYAPAAQVFDQKVIATGGIMQPATVIFNENDLSIEARNTALEILN